MTTLYFVIGALSVIAIITVFITTWCMYQIFKQKVINSQLDDAIDAMRRVAGEDIADLDRRICNIMKPSEFRNLICEEVSKALTDTRNSCERPTTYVNTKTYGTGGDADIATTLFND